MSDTPTPGPANRDVVVGVDGSAASVNAVRYGLEEAARLGGTVRLVHVIQDFVPMGPMVLLPLDELLAAGRAVLEGVLEEIGPEVPIETTLRQGSRVATLASDARAARVLVVGTDRRTAGARLLTGNTTTGVAASSAAPVVSVPETWRAGERRGAVLVGVKNPAHAVELFGEAFAVAQARGSRLVVMHAWRLPSGYDDIIASRVARAEWDERSREELTTLVSQWRVSYPDVEVELRTVHEQPAHALVEASREADEVLLVRRAHGILHLGATARTVLRESDCPVRIVPPGYVMSPPALVLEDAGALLT